jgi:hypothetical protein
VNFYYLMNKLGHTPRVIQPRRSVGAEQSVCVYFPVRVFSYPFGVRRTPGFYLRGCVPPRAVFCWHTTLFA